jgi:hypothetical protein
MTRLFDALERVEPVLFSTVWEELSESDEVVEV